MDATHYSTKRIRVLSHKKLLEKTLSHVYEHGLQEPSDQKEQAPRIVLPDSPRFFFLLEQRFNKVGYMLE